MKTQNDQIVFTNTARCRDCYKCLRHCPVKAIRMSDGQAYIDPLRCIACGTCIRQCPQKAKTYRRDIDRLEAFFESGEYVAAPVAPSYTAVYNAWQGLRFASALRKLGFKYIGHTSQGAYHVACNSISAAKNADGKITLASACPVFVSYMQKYKSEFVQALSPVVSPMTAHSLMLKEKLGDKIKTVFIGPCVAKKKEAQQGGSVDLVITFEELNELFVKKNVDLACLEESNFDDLDCSAAAIFPLLGGLIRTSGETDDGIGTKYLRADGIDKIEEAVKMLEVSKDTIFIEPLFCVEGCINGPASGTESNVFERRASLLKYISKLKDIPADDVSDQSIFSTVYKKDDSLILKKHSETEIQAILEKGGKASVDQQLNCGACGYKTCRDKGTAVLDGMAQLEMCIPFMRRQAEQRTDKIIMTSPNGILITDNKLNIISMNPSFKKMFMCSDSLLGRNISYLMDQEPFEQVICGNTEKYEGIVDHSKYGLICHEIIYRLDADEQVVAIFVDATRTVASEKMLNELKKESAIKAKELLDMQINMSQKIAEYLGQSAAKSEEIVRNLMDN